MKSLELLHSLAVLVCRDNDEDGDDGEEGEEIVPGGDPKGSAANVQFTPEQQAKVNEILAKDKRKNEARFKQLEASYQELLETKTLSDEERASLQEKLDDLQARNMTEKQRVAHEKKKLQEQYDNQLTEFREKATKWEGMYFNSTIQRALTDAAAKADAFQPVQVVTLLREKTKLVEDVDDTGKPTGRGLVPMVDFPDIDPDTGRAVMTQRTPEDAVKRMKELPELYGNLFKSGVAQGIGSGNYAFGEVIDRDGHIDPKKLTTEQYMKLRKENPKALGLKKGRR